LINEEEKLIRATIRSLSRALILWLVSQNPISGYAVTKEIQRLTGQKISSGIVYPLLYEMEEKGLISGVWKEKGRRRIKYYSITIRGLDLLGKLRKFFRGPIKEVLKSLLGEK